MKHNHAQRYFHDIVLQYQGDECLIWPFACNGKGYAQIGVKRKVNNVARLVCIAVHGPSHLQTRHLCGNGRLGCVSPRHVVWGTARENALDWINRKKESK